MFRIFFGVIVITATTVFVLSRFLFKSDELLKDYSEPIPWFLLFSTNFLALSIRELADYISPPPPFKVLEDVFGNPRAEILYVCSKIEIPDILKDQSLSVDEIASIAKLHPNNLLRLLRAAETFGYFIEDLTSKTWRNSKLSSILRTDHPNTLRHLLHHLREDHFSQWDILYSSMKNDVDAFKAVNNLNLWEYFDINPIQEEQFSLAMTNMDTFSATAQVKDFSWAKHKRIIDLGGGTGSFLAKVLRANTEMTGLLFDRSSVIQKAKQVWKYSSHSSLFERVQFIEGSFFDVDRLPHFKEGDIIHMRYILHDWNDVKCTQLLLIIRKSIGELKEIKLVLNEIVLTPKDPIGIKYVFDIHMKLGNGNSMERYSNQWEHLLNSCGFKVVNIHPTRSLNSIIEAVPV